MLSVGRFRRPIPEGAVSTQGGADRVDRSATRVRASLPQDDAADLAAAAIALDAGHPEAVAALLDPMIRRGAADPEAYRLFGLACLSMRNLRGAETSFQRALSVLPHSRPCHDAWRKLLAAARAWPLLLCWAQRGSALDVDPGSLHDRAVALLQLGASMPAISLSRRALALVPAQAMSWALLGDAGTLSARPDDAARSLARAWALHPSSPDFVRHLILLLTKAGRAAEAVRRFGRTAETAGSADLMADLAVAHDALGQTDAAERLLLRSALLASSNPNAPTWLAQVAGLAMTRGARTDVATALHRLLSLHPADGTAYSNMSEIVRHDDPRAAVGWAQRAIAVEPMLGEAWGNLALAHRALQQFKPVERGLRISLTVAPSLASSLGNLAYWTNLDGRPDESEQWARRALAIDPGNASYALNLSIALLTLGKLGSGFRLYEARLTQPGSPPKETQRIDRPRWEGGSLGGRTLLVWAEQGIGDQFFFARYLQMLSDIDGHVVVECDPRLVPLYRRSFPQMTIRPALTSIEASLGGIHIDLQIPVCSLGLPFTAETQAAVEAARSGRPWPTSSYLRSASAKVDAWRLFSTPNRRRFRLAVSWRSGNMSSENLVQYMDAATLLRIVADLPITVVNVQYACTDDEVAFFGRELADFVHPPINLKDDLDDVAAILAGCDLLVTPHTAAMYLAAAQGVPTWSFLAGRSWSTHGLEHQPLFPHIRHFRRRPTESWDAVVAAIRRALLEELGRWSVWSETAPDLERR